MVTKAEARRIAQAAILDIWSVEGDEPIIFDESTLDREWGWVFFWGSRRYAETRLSRFALAGNAPVLVKRVDGSAHFTTTAGPVEEFLSEYEDEFGLVAPVWGAAGYGAYEIAELMGHADIKTSRRYAHPVSERKQAAVEATRRGTAQTCHSPATEAEQPPKLVAVNS